MDNFLNLVVFKTTRMRTKCSAIMIIMCLTWMIPLTKSQLRHTWSEDMPIPQELEYVLATRKGTNINYRLPRTIVPLHYVLTVMPFFDELLDEDEHFTFNGEVEITIRPRVDTNTVTLHASHEKLVISDEDVIIQNNESLSIHITRIFRDEVTDFLVIKTGTILKAHDVYNLTISFWGDLEDENQMGFYYSSVPDENGETIWIAYTQFQPSSAREAFPCFDEPVFKATFDLNIIHLQNYTAISNMKQRELPIRRTEDRVLTSFDTTVVMSTYLLAFAVVQYKNLTNKYQNHTIWTTAEHIQFAPRTLEIAERSVEFFNLNLGINYQLDKLDELSVPDFTSSAMENWGLIIYHDEDLVFNPEEDSSQNKELIFLTIAHEICHQWFGNLVTPLWWKYTWLSEGFATYFMYIAIDNIVKNSSGEFAEIDWRLREKFAVAIRQESAFYNDFNSNIPLTRSVETIEESVDIFDKFTYNKGAAILWMLEHILSTPIFMKGLNYYLTEKSYGNVEPTDLWRNLEKAYNELCHRSSAFLGSQTITDIGNSWTLQGYYPLVTVTKTGNTVLFSQEIYQHFDDPKSHQYVWLIPMNYALKSHPNFTKTTADWFLQNLPVEMNLTSAENDWIIVNNQQTGYYRVNYDFDNWQKLIEALQNTQTRQLMPKVTLAQLIDDSLDLCHTGHLSYATIGLDMIQFLSAETDYIPWYAAIRQLGRLDAAITDNKLRKEYMTYQIELINKSYYGVNGFNSSANDGHIMHLHRDQILRRACYVGHAICRRDAEAKLAWFLDSIANRIEPDLMLAVYLGGLRNNNRTLYAKMLQRLEETTSEYEVATIQTARLCLGEPEYILLILEEVFNNKTTTSETDLMGKFMQIFNCGPKPLKIVLKYVSKNSVNIYNNHGYDVIEIVLESMKPNLITNSHKSMIKQISMSLWNIRDNHVSKTLKSFEKKVDRNIEINTRILTEIEEWFSRKRNVASLGLRTFVPRMYLCALILGIFYNNK